MALENNQLDGHGDIAQFLEKFKENTFSPANPPEGFFAPREGPFPPSLPNTNVPLKNWNKKSANWKTALKPLPDRTN